MSQMARLPDSRVVPLQTLLTIISMVVLKGETGDEEVKALRVVAAAARRLVDRRWRNADAVRQEQLGGREIQDLHGALRDLELKGF